METEGSTSLAKFAGNKKMIVFVIVGIVVLVIGGLVMQMVSKKATTMVGEKTVEKMIENATGGNAKVNVDSGKVTVKTTEGTFSTGTELPEGWPKDVPIYPEATVTYSGSSTPKDGKSGFSVMLLTKDTVKQVSDYVSKELIGQGWTIESTQNIVNTTVMAAVKNDRDLTVSVNASDEGTVITLVTVK